MDRQSRGGDGTSRASFDFLGSTLTLKDVIQYVVLIVGAVVFVTNMNARIDKLTDSVNELKMSFTSKQAVDEAQTLRITALETSLALLKQKLQISDE